MKTKLLALVLLISYLGFAQLTYVPDDNFENYLETHDASGHVNLVNSMGNGIMDNYVPTSSISSVTSLVIANLGIADLTGIEDFVNIETLWCSDNQLVNLDLTNNIALRNLTCPNNLLTGLDVSQNLNLGSIYCNNNEISSLNFTTNIALTNINCSNNLLTELNVQNVMNSNIFSFDATGNPSLTCIQVDNVSFSTTNWTNIDAQANFSNNCSGLETFVPNNPFEYYLETHNASGVLVGINSTTNMGNGVMDNYVPTAKINTVTSLNVSNENITDLTGIEGFAALTQLRCYGNSLQALDVTQNTALTFLNCSSNQIQTLDVTQNTALIQLRCGYNQIQTLDVTQNTALNDLRYTSNQIQNLDVTQNTALTHLECGSNQIQNLDVTQNIALIQLRCDLNQIQTLDVTQNTALTYLSCFANQLQILDVTQNTVLRGLICTGNQLQTMDLTQNTVLTKLHCRNNQFTSLNVKNGNNINISNIDFDSRNNPNLTCIQVDDFLYSLTNWTYVDSASSFSVNCTQLETYVPDDNFENYLETHNASGNTVALGDATSMGNGIANDDYVTTSNIDTVTNLQIPSKNISNLTGIEDFVGLTRLNCGDNQLQTLNVTQNTALTELYCHRNQLQTLAVTQNTALTELRCYRNQLQTLDVTQNTALNYLFCYTNQLQILDVTQNTALTEFDCSQNQIQILDVTQNTALTELDCYQNQLQVLDVSQNTALTNFNCYNNQLQTLDVTQNLMLTRLICHVNQLTTLNVKNGNNTSITSFNATDNPNLRCITVDNATWSTANWTNIDVTSSFANSQAECDALVTVNNYNLENNFSIYPNPASNHVILKTNKASYYKIYNTAGQLLNKGILSEGENHIAVSNFKNGLYFIKIDSNTSITTLKMIIKN